MKKAKEECLTNCRTQMETSPCACLPKGESKKLLRRSIGSGMKHLYAQHENRPVNWKQNINPLMLNSKHKWNETNNREYRGDGHKR